jgi:peptide/nickel transport system substrate-binding protein
VLIDSVTKGDSDKQAVVTFKQEYPWWEGLFNYVLPPQVKDADTFNTGEVSFVKNEKWWGDEGELDKITYRYLEDQASLNAFQAGELDATRVATKDRFATASNMGDKGGYPHRTASLQLPGHPQRQVPAAGGCGGP